VSARPNVAYVYKNFPLTRNVINVWPAIVVAGVVANAIIVVDAVVVVNAIIVVDAGVVAGIVNAVVVVDIVTIGAVIVVDADIAIHAIIVVDALLRLMIFFLKQFSLKKAKKEIMYYIN